MELAERRYGKLIIALLSMFWRSAQRRVYDGERIRTKEGARRGYIHMHAAKIHVHGHPESGDGW
jgi:hypothetical protein